MDFEKSVLVINRKKKCYTTMFIKGFCKVFQAAVFSSI